MYYYIICLSERNIAEIEPHEPTLILFIYHGLNQLNCEVIAIIIPAMYMHYDTLKRHVHIYKR